MTLGGQLVVTGATVARIVGDPAARGLDATEFQPPCRKRCAAAARVFLPSPKAFERDNEKSTVTRGEVRAFMGDREIALARDRDQERILRCSRRAIGYR